MFNGRVFIFLFFGTFILSTKKRPNSQPLPAVGDGLALLVHCRCQLSQPAWPHCSDALHFIPAVLVLLAA